MKNLFINADFEIELPSYVTVHHVEYPDPECIDDYEGTCPQYWVSIAEEDFDKLDKFCDENNLYLFE